MSDANKEQIGGSHYKVGGEEHWDRVSRLGLDYFQACITKYVERCWLKNGVEDLKKALHFIQKYIELKSPKKPAGHVEESVSDFKNTVSSYEYGQVTSTGWTQFIFEGADIQGYLFTCRKCKRPFHAHPEYNPHAYHDCHDIVDSAVGADATSSYIDQG